MGQNPLNQFGADKQIWWRRLQINLFEGVLVEILKLRIFWALERLMQVDLSIVFVYHYSRFVLQWNLKSNRFITNCLEDDTTN